MPQQSFPPDTAGDSRGSPLAARRGASPALTDQSLEEVALEDVDDPLDGVPQLPVLRLAQLGAVLLQQAQRSLGICKRTAGTAVSTGVRGGCPHTPTHPHTRGGDAELGTAPPHRALSGPEPRGAGPGAAEEPGAALTLLPDGHGAALPRGSASHARSPAGLRVRRGRGGGAARLPLQAGP